MRKLYLLVPLILFIHLSCEDKKEDSLTPSELIVGYWEVTENVTHYKQCDGGNGPYEQYNSSNPSVGGYWNWLINDDGTWSYDWMWSNGNFYQSTGTYHVTGDIFSIEFDTGSDIWYFDFNGDDILNLSYERDCDVSGTILSTRKWERKNP